MVVKEPKTQTIRLRFQGPASSTASLSVAASMSAHADHCEAACSQAAAVLVQRMQQTVAGVANVIGGFPRGGVGVVISDEAQDAAMLGPGLLAGGLGPDFEPARA